MHPDLAAAYDAALYVVRFGDSEVVGRVRPSNPELDQLLDELGSTSVVFLTAWNPGSVPTGPEANDLAHAALEEEVRRLGLRALPHEGRSADGTWREEGLAILDLPQDVAQLLARRFAQTAFAVAHLRGPLRVLPTVQSP